MIQGLGDVLDRCGLSPQAEVWAGVASPTGTNDDSRGLDVGARYYCASLAKQVTAVCFALLCRDDTIRADDVLSQWMEGLPAWAGTVTLRQLLTHTAGLPAHAPGFALEDSPRWSNELALESLQQLTPSQVQPGQSFCYSGLGYVCLAEAMQRASGKPLAQLARERIFGPLGMPSTQFWSGPSAHPPQAVPVPTHLAVPHSNGDGGLWSTVPDLFRWGRAMCLDELGVLDLVVEPGSLDDGTTLDYCWGVRRTAFEGVTFYSHGGSWPGISSKLLWSPDLEVVVAVIARTDDAVSVTALAEDLAVRCVHTQDYGAQSS